MVELWEAACLIADIEPPRDQVEKIWAEHQLKDFPRAFHDVWETMNRDLVFSQVQPQPYSGRMLHRVALASIVEWAGSKGLALPAEWIRKKQLSAFLQDEDTRKDDPVFRAQYARAWELYDEKAKWESMKHNGDPFRAIAIEERLSAINSELAAINAGAEAVQLGLPVKAQAVAQAADSATPVLVPLQLPVIHDTSTNSFGESGTSDWILNKPKRYQGYRKPLFDVLKSAKAAGQPIPSAHDVLDAFKVMRPPEISEVMVSGIKYYSSNGGLKEADLDALRKAIQRMTQPKTAE
jgi:hypothetical protein